MMKYTNELEVGDQIQSRSGRCWVTSVEANDDGDLVVSVQDMGDNVSSFAPVGPFRNWSVR